MPNAILPVEKEEVNIPQDDDAPEPCETCGGEGYYFHDLGGGDGTTGPCDDCNPPKWDRGMYDEEYERQRRA